MYVYKTVNEAFRGLVETIQHDGVRQDSRNGPVLRFPGPMIVTITSPERRVLFNSARDCNPFFHLFEAIWMLAGCNLVAPLVYYNPQMLDYSDSGITLHGAYGHRWIRNFGYNQLQSIVNSLIRNPTCRRQVLTMWSPADLKLTEGRDLPCNTHIYFSIRTSPAPRESPQNIVHSLDMTVCNRSNDLVWGLCGANAVHLTFLQEVLAGAIGVEVGHWHQMTNNLHVYLNDRWKPEAWMSGEQPEEGEYPDTFPVLQGLSNMGEFTDECRSFVDRIDREYNSQFLQQVALPMCAAFRQHKLRNYRGDSNALVLANGIQAEDWRLVAIRWLTKRRDQWEAKSGKQIWGIPGEPSND